MSWEVAVVSVPGHLSPPCHQSWALQEGQKHWSGVEPLGTGEMGRRKRRGYEGKALGMLSTQFGKGGWTGDTVQGSRVSAMQGPLQ